jgi:glycosyltransferase involved in cell wall biosynthesis
MAKLSRRRARRGRTGGSKPIESVCVFGHFDPNYVRNHQVRESLASLGHKVVSVQSEGPLRRRWPRLARDARSQTFDALWVAFLGYSDVPLAWFLSRRRRVPLVFDAFVLLHDTFVTDRETVRRRSLTALYLRALETTACHLADVVVIDTVEHAERLAQRTHLDPEKVRVLHVGSQYEDVCSDDAAETPFTVVFFGTFMPLHGVDVVVRAAALLRDDPTIRFLLVGDGQTKTAAVALATNLACGNVTFLDPLHDEALRHLLCEANVLLGVFGTSVKARVVVPNKVVDALAIGRPVVTAATPAIDTMLDASQIRTVAPGDPRALADAIASLRSDPLECRRLAAAGRLAYETHFAPAARRLEMAAILQSAQR